MLFFVKNEYITGFFIFQTLKTLSQPMLALSWRRRVGNYLILSLTFFSPRVFLSRPPPPLSTSSLLNLVALSIQFSWLLERISCNCLLRHILFLHLLAILGDSVHI